MNLLRNFLYALIALMSLLLSALGAEPTWSWTAPEPPLPETWYWDYGWDSTSNGPLPASEFAQREPSTAIRLAQRQSAPLPPGLPERQAPEAQSLLNGLSVSPYYTVGFQDFNGKAHGGAGLDVGLNLSKTIQIVGFAESDSFEGIFVDRFGGGVQLTGRLGSWLKPFARLSVGYSNVASGGLGKDEVFIRPQFGGIVDVWKYRNWHASITGSWGLDVDTQGNAAQRLFGGIVLGTSF